MKVASSYVGRGTSLFQETRLRALSICLHTSFQFSTTHDVHSRDVSLESMQSLNRKRSLSPLCGKVGAKCLTLGLMLRFCLAVPNDFPMTSPNIYLFESIQSGVLPEQTTMK